MADATITQGTTLEISEITSPLDYEDILGIVDFTAFDGSAAEIDVTHLQSTRKQYLKGIADSGSFTINCNFIDGDDGQDLLKDAYDSQDAYAFRYTRSDGSTATFQGYVMTASESGGVDAKVDASYSIRVDGVVTFAPAS